MSLAGESNRYTLQYTRKAARQISEIPQADRQRVRQGIESLAQWPGHQSDVIKLQGVSEPIFRLRVGRWRVIFLVDADTTSILVLEVLPRNTAYRGL